MNHSFSKTEKKLLNKITNNPEEHERIIKEILSQINEINIKNEIHIKELNSLNKKNDSSQKMSNIATNSAIAASAGMLISTALPGTIILPLLASIIGFLGNGILNKIKKSQEDISK